MPPDARLGDAPHLQALHEPAPALRLVPRHILQQVSPRGWPDRLRSMAGFGGGAVLVHIALGACFFFLLSFRDAETPTEIEIPVDVVTEAPKPPRPTSAPKAAGAQAGAAQGIGDAGSGAGTPASLSAPPQQTPGSPAQENRPAVALSAPTAPAEPAPSPPRAAPKTAEAGQKPAPPSPPVAAPKPAPTAPARPVDVAPPKLVAPPPEAARSATQDKDNKPANLVPDEHQTDQATREARPTGVPRALATSDARAASSVPVPAKPPPVDRPTPAIPAKAPSQADKLAAALPMDAAAMPMGFRSVMAGNAAAQLSAAYGGVVQGRIRQAQAELAQTAYAQRLSGTVAVTFTIDDAGKLASLAVAQSSGNAQLDALALHAIELAAPFPPPPPEAEHTFNKAFLVGG